MITTPRSVKRFANSYGVFTALRRLRDEPDIEDNASAEVRAAMVLLAALIGFPARGPRLLTELHRTTGCDVGWHGFLDEQAPHSIKATDESARGNGDGGGPSSSSGDSQAAREWTALIRALRVVTTRADAAGLSLPDNLSHWRQRIGDVGRLSFPPGP